MCNCKFVRLYILVAIFSIVIYANDFETNCLGCHKNTLRLHIYMSKYTLKYSSATRVKDAMFKYMKNPTKQSSIMPVGFIEQFGIKAKSKLSDNELKKSIEQYYQKYNLKQFIELSNIKN